MLNPLPEPTQLPYALYRAAQVRALDKYLIEECGIQGSVLMERAGAAAWNIAKQRWPSARDITVVCGIGNNGGDGYVLARLALQNGYVVRVLQLGDSKRLTGDALDMAKKYQAVGGEVYTFQGIPNRTDLIVDAILGTGIERTISGDWAVALNAINQHSAPVLALDIPSGLNADTGQVMGHAVQAQLTVSFIALKQGMFTGQGQNYCGDIKFAGLEIPAVTYRREILSARRIDWQRYRTMLSPRPRCAHKGNFGHVLLVGGSPGMSGALRLAGEAAARCGAGLVTMATHPDHAAWLNLIRPELMCHPITKPADLDPLLAKSTVVAIGPGLGQSDWARDLLTKLIASPKPLVVDADALNILATSPLRCTDWVLTPHPGEAARLLNCSTASVEENRFATINALWAKYGGTIVLKGAGTLIQSDSQNPPAICSDGNPGMASGGMGDLLTGVIASLIAQGFAPKEAACMGVCLHGAAGDQAAADSGERGMLACDLLCHLRNLVN